MRSKSVPALHPTMSSANSDEEKVDENIAEIFNDGSASKQKAESITLDSRRFKRYKPAEKDVVAGNLHRCETYDERVYYSRRTESSHYLYKKNGYPIDTSILEELAADGVTTIFITVAEQNKLMEFSLEQYQEREMFNLGQGNQRCPPERDALRVWPNGLKTLFDE